MPLPLPFTLNPAMMYDRARARAHRSGPPNYTLIYGSTETYKLIYLRSTRTPRKPLRLPEHTFMDIDSIGTDRSGTSLVSLARAVTGTRQPPPQGGNYGYYGYPPI